MVSALSTSLIFRMGMSSNFGKCRCLLFSLSESKAVVNIRSCSSRNSNLMQRTAYMRSTLLFESLPILLKLIEICLTSDSKKSVYTHPKAAVGSHHFWVSVGALPERSRKQRCFNLARDRDMRFFSRRFLCLVTRSISKAAMLETVGRFWIRLVLKAYTLTVSDSTTLQSS
jgi:hypothetical protein